MRALPATPMMALTAVAVDLWSGGNQVAEMTAGPEKSTGPANPVNTLPKWANLKERYEPYKPIFHKAFSLLCVVY